MRKSPSWVVTWVPPSHFAIVKISLESCWSKPDLVILGLFQRRKKSSARLISFLGHLRTKLIKCFMTENSCGNIGKIKSYETINGEYLSSLEEVFSPADAPSNFGARRSNLCQWFVVHLAHLTAPFPMALFLSSSTSLTSMRQLFVPHCAFTFQHAEPQPQAEHCCNLRYLCQRELMAIGCQG